MLSEKDIEELDSKIKKLPNGPFDQILPLFQDLVWQYAEKNHVSGPAVVSQYFDWKAKHR